MKDFIDYELALKLKEKGYPQDSLRRYDEDGNKYLGDNTNAGCCAPRIAEVLKWLREEKAISVEPCATPYNCWYYMIKCKGEIKATYMDNKYKTYEGAVIAGIEYTLDNLI